MNNSPEQSGGGEARRSEPTAAEVQSRIDRTSSLLARLRTYPSDWTSKNGESKQEVEKRLEDALSSMSIMQETLSESSSDTSETKWDNLKDVPMGNATSQQEVHVSEAHGESPVVDPNIRPAGESIPNTVEAPHQQPRAKFFEVDGTYIPIMPRSICLGATNA